MSLPTEEAIKTLKAEIIAQDWRISPKRVEIIGNSLSCLQQHFKDRKATHAMLSMAIGVLEYIKKRGGNPPATIDFVKEAMAHVVGQYEDLKYDPNREEEIFKTLLKHFTILKEKIKTGGRPTQKKPIKSPRAVPSVDSAPDQTITQLELNEPTVQKNGPQSASQIENIEAEKLIEDLKDSLEKAGEVGSTIGNLLNQLLATQAKKELAAKNPPQEKLIQKSLIQNKTNVTQESPPEIDGRAHCLSADYIKKCPPTALRQVAIGQTSVAVLENGITAVKPVNRSRMSTYIKNSSVPLKDFNRLFQGLANQFTGPLSKVRHGKLKNLSLPLMVPQGLNLPESPDDDGSDLLMIYNGNWHGVIACSKPDQKSQTMIKFRKSQNGDIAGTGFMEDDTEVMLLDSLSILRREGFLITSP